jgi:hypothetical protein
MEVTFVTNQGNKVLVECEQIPRTGEELTMVEMPELYEDCDFGSPTWYVQGVNHYIKQGKHEGVIIYIKNEEE